MNSVQTQLAGLPVLKESLFLENVTTIKRLLTLENRSFPTLLTDDTPRNLISADILN